MKRDKIIDDLLKKHPKGSGREKLTYTSKREWSYDRRRYCITEIPSVEQFGYTDEEVFELGFLCQSDVTSYVRNRFFPGKSSWEIGRKKSTVTRRANRIWQRIEGGVGRIRRGGADGVYRVKRASGYNPVPLGHLYAKNQEEASESAKLFFDYLVDDGRGVKVEFVKLGTVHEVHALNCSTNDKANARIVALEQEIADCLKQIEGLKAQQTTLNLVEAQQLAVEMGT